MKFSWLSTFLLAALEVRAAAQGLSFIRPHYIQIGGPLCCSVLTGDFNGDGKIDIAVANSTEGVTILLGKGDGSFTPKVNPIPGFTITALVAAADVNLDGRLDVVAVASVSGNDESVVLLGKGDGTFAAPLELGPYDVKAVADFNGDGKPDLLVYPPLGGGFPPLGDDGFTVRFGNGDGTFQTSGPLYPLPRGDFAYAVAGDFNHDGKVDVAQVTGRPGDDKVFIWLGNGDGTFRALGGQSMFGSTSLATGDFNADGKVDLAVGDHTSVVILLGNGDGSFQTRGNFAMPANTVSDRVLVGDFNGDGKADVAQGSTIFLGNGSGSLLAPATFGQPVEVFIAHSASMIAAGDFNGDGKPDLVFPGGNGTSISILINNTPNPDRSASALSAATYTATIAPGSIATVFGTGFAQTAASAPGLPLPTVLQNTSVRVLDQNGGERLAPLLYVSPTQINFLVPPETAVLEVRNGNSGYAIVNVDHAGPPLVDGARATPIFVITPGFFTADGSGRGIPAATAIRVQADGTQTPVPVVNCSAPGVCSPVPIDLNGGGTVYLSLYGTGFANAERATCRGGNMPLTVTYSGPQKEFPGLDQLNLMLPFELPRGAVDIQCHFSRTGTGDVYANTVTIYAK